MTIAGPPPAAGGPSAGGLRRFARPPRAASPVAAAAAGGRCELCGTPVRHEHPHLVNLRHRSIACACQACALLFTRSGGPYRAVPDRVLVDPQAPLTAAEWAELQIPVAIAFFFVNSALGPREDDPPHPPHGRVVASYPSPAGVTECELDLAAWDRLAATHPLLRAPAPDVEAILVLADGSPDGTGAVETFLVPIDVCYSLAGALRLGWHGFDGGAEVKRALADLRARLRRVARPMAKTATVPDAPPDNTTRGDDPPYPPATARPMAKTPPATARATNPVGTNKPEI
jgi:hypothetical protein